MNSYQDLNATFNAGERLYFILYLLYHTSSAYISETLYTHRLTVPEREEIQLEILDSANNVSSTIRLQVISVKINVSNGFADAVWHRVG